MSGEKCTLELAIKAEVLVSLMTRLGREAEAKGGEYYLTERGFDTLVWRINTVPEIATEGDVVILTWKCGVGNERNGLYPPTNTPCILWRIAPAFLGVRVEAFCGWPEFKPVFYNLINFAEDMAGKAQGAATADQTREKHIPETKTPEGDGLPIPDTPPIPGQGGATWDDAFDWYYRAGRGKCPTLKHLANLIAMEYGTVRKRHSEYTAQYGKNPIPK